MCPRGVGRSSRTSSPQPLICRGGIGKELSKCGIIELYLDVFPPLYRYTILAFSTSFVLTWVLFAFIWWAIAYFHGDLEEENLPGLIDTLISTFEGVQYLKVILRWRISVSKFPKNIFQVSAFQHGSTFRWCQTDERRVRTLRLGDLRIRIVLSIQCGDSAHDRVSCNIGKNAKSRFFFLLFSF